MAPEFTWITFLAARQVLAQRLADPNNIFWTDAENKLYLTEALRTFNALTEYWNADFQFQATSASVWYNLATQANSSRLQTVKDSDLYTLMQYHLLEQPTGGGTWTGTSQFALADLQGALQRRRDEVIQVSGCNMVQLPPQPSVPNSNRIQLPDTVLETRRARFIPSRSPTDYGPPITLTREDRAVFDAFEPDHLQEWTLPASWSEIAQPPLFLETDTAQNVPGVFDIIAVQSGPTFNPPTQTLLGVPDDWSWVCKWGALADLLSRESEATDRVRAQFCLQRYMDGLKAMRESNWLVSGEINGVPVDTVSLAEMDSFSNEWQDNESYPNVVVAGTDFIAACPVQTGRNQVGVDVTVVGNAPIPVLDTDFVQVSRDTFDAVISYAQVLANLKMGGADFTDSLQLMADFANTAMEVNKRLSKIGLFADVLRSESKRQNEAQER